MDYDSHKRWVNNYMNPRPRRLGTAAKTLVAAVSIAVAGVVTFDLTHEDIALIALAPISYEGLCLLAKSISDDTPDGVDYLFGPRGGRYTMGRSWDGGEYRRYR